LSSQPIRGYLIVAAAVVIVGVLISASVFVALGGEKTTTRTKTTTPTAESFSTSPSTESSTTTAGQSSTYSSTVSSSGLRLQVTMNSTNLPPHGEVAVQVEVLNTQSRNVSLEVVPNQNMSAWNKYDYFCGSNPSVSLVGFELLRGDFAAGNVSSAGPPLQLAASSAALICITNLPLNSTTFLPNSDRTMSTWTYANALQPPYPVTAEVNATTGYCVGSDLSGSCHETAGILGCWNASSGSAADGSLASPSFTYLPPGEYTVAAMDDWGQTVYAHFHVGSAIRSPVEVVSVTGPIPPYNPGGPVVSVTLKNVGTSTITALDATLGVENVENGVYGYSFVFNVDIYNFLVPGQTIGETHTLIGAGYDTGVDYPLTINGTLVNGTQFSYTVQVQVVPPTVSASSTSSVSYTTSGDTTQTRATVTDSLDNMELRLSLNTSSSSGVSISVLADEYNPLASMNNVTAAND
jgi:hypothetical protein